MPAFARLSSNSGLVMPLCNHTAAGWAARMSSRCGGRSLGFLNTSKMSMLPAVVAHKATVSRVTTSHQRVASRAALTSPTPSSFITGLMACDAHKRRLTHVLAASFPLLTHLAHPAHACTPVGPECELHRGRTQALAQPLDQLTAGTVARKRLPGWPAVGQQTADRLAHCCMLLCVVSRATTSDDTVASHAAALQPLPCPLS